MSGACLGPWIRGPHADNTVIVLWTDHGWQFGEKKHWRKFTLWERACRVPLIFAGPGVEAKGELCDRSAELLDIYPTLERLGRLAEARGTRQREPATPASELPEPSGITRRSPPWEPTETLSAPSGGDTRAIRMARSSTIMPTTQTNGTTWRAFPSTPRRSSGLRRCCLKILHTRKVMQFRDLPEERRRLTDLLPDHYHASDAANYVPPFPGPQ